MTNAAFVTTLHYYGRTCAKKTLLFDGRQCSGPAPAKCFQCAGKHYGTVRGPIIVTTNAAFGGLEEQMTDATIAVSHATAEKNGYAGGDEGLFIVPNMVVPPPAAVTPNEALDSALPDSPFMLYVGDQRDAKGFRVLCHAYSSNGQSATARRDRGQNSRDSILIARRNACIVRITQHLCAHGLGAVPLRYCSVSLGRAIRHRDSGMYGCRATGRCLAHRRHTRNRD